MLKEEMMEVCDYSLLFKYECEHCLAMDDSDITPDHEYEVVSVFPSQFGGTCTLNMTHRVRKGDFVSKLRRADNPLISVPGVACKHCTSDYPRAKGI